MSEFYPETDGIEHVCHVCPLCDKGNIRVKPLGSRLPFTAMIPERCPICDGVGAIVVRYTKRVN